MFTSKRCKGYLALVVDTRSSEVRLEDVPVVRDDLSYEEQPVQILGRKEKELRNKTISLVKVLWRNHLVEEATWEREDQMRSQYPHLLHDTSTNFVDEIFL